MATSARKENRWRKAIYAENDLICDRKREIEAAFMTRGPRPKVSLTIQSALTRKQVRRWMRNNANDYEGPTALVEGANVALNLPKNALDDETHWIWDEAVDAMEWVGVAL